MRTKIIAPANNKGGVGKSFVSSIIADYISKVKQRKTLLIDLDPQCNQSQHVLDMDIDPANPEGHIPPLHPDYQETDEAWDGRSSIADIFLRPKEGVLAYPTMNENLDILPANAADLLLVEQCKKDEIIEKIYQCFENFINSEDVQNEYDYIVIDTAPSKGPLTRCAIRSATDIIIPAVMEDKPIRGVFGMLQLWMQESTRRNQDNPLNLIGILPNMFDGRTTLHNDLYKSLKHNNEIRDLVMPCKLAKRIIYAENDCQNAVPRSLFDLPNSHKAKQEVMEVCGCIMQRIEENVLEMEAV